MQKLSELFDVIYPATMILNQQILNEKGINFVSSKGINNGVSAKIQETDKHKKYSKYAITVALKGSVLSSFVQPKEFYIAHQTAVLYPKLKLTENELIYYCLSIRANKYRFNYGRQADRTLKDLLLPSKNEIPEWVNETDYKFDENLTKPLNNLVLKLDILNWRYFPLTKLFYIKGTKTTPVAELKKYGPGKYPYVTTQATNNGVEGFYGYYTEEGNVLTVDSAVLGYCSYQPLPFSASDHVEKLIPKFNMNKYVALFISTIINAEQYRYNYGRKCCQERMKKSHIKLPAKNRKPDFKFMESYIKSLPYSSSI